MNKWKELTEAEIITLEGVLSDHRTPSMVRNVIKHVLELARAEDEPEGEEEDEPDFEVGDKVMVVNKDDYSMDFIGTIVALNNDTAKIKVEEGLFVEVSIDRIELCLGPCTVDGEEPAETNEESSFINQVSYYDAMRMELAKEIAIACVASDKSYSPYTVIKNSVKVANGIVDAIKKNRDRR